MKKLLSILTISTLTASIPVPLLANTTLERTKNDFVVSNSNNELLSLIKIDGISDNVISLSLDSKDNIYFGTKDGAFVLKHGATTPTKIDFKQKFIYVSSIMADSKDNIYFVATNGIWGGVFKIQNMETTPTKIIDNSKINSISLDSKENIYLGTDNGVFVLKHGETTPTKISGINDTVFNVAVDSKENIYFDTFNGAFVLKHGETTPTKIIENVISLSLDSKDNIYFGTKAGAFVLKHGETTPTKINGINYTVNSISVDNNSNVYFGTFNGALKLSSALSWVKQQSQFTVDSSKTKTWTRPDLLSVDGEVNIDIANPNIDKVVFDNVQQPQTNKHWTINVKPEIAAKDHNLQVTFTLDGKQYKSEIIVSMQAKIDPPTVSKQENLSDVINFDNNNDLGNILDNNDNTISSAITQKNARTVDFSQIEIEKKDDKKASLTAKSDSKSYTGSVDIKYNVVPATVVDLKISLATSSKTVVVEDYLGQIDTSNLTNPVNTFYYASSESTITMVKPTASSVITGIVYGCDDKWNKTSQTSNIDPVIGIKLDGSQLNTKEGKYAIELSDNLGHTNNVYLQIAPNQTIWNYFDTDNGKQFEIWADENGYKNIRGYSASQLNKLFVDSKNWQQLASDSQFATAVADWFKTNGKLISKEPLTKKQVLAQLKTQIPNNIKIPDVSTSNYDINKVSFELSQSEFKPNDKVNITVKYSNVTADSFTLQIKDSKLPDNNNKGGDSKLWIIGVVVGVLAGLGLAYLLFKRFVFDNYFLPKIKNHRHDKLVAQVRKEEAEKNASEQSQENRELDDEQNNKGGEE